MAESTAQEKQIERVIDNAVEVAAVDPKVPGVTAANATAVAKAIKDEVTPVLVNAANAEPLVQSRIMWGNVVAGLAPLVILIFAALRTLGFDVPNISEERVIEIGGALVTLGGVAYVFYGRLKTDLKPLFWRPKA